MYEHKARKIESIRENEGQLKRKDVSPKNTFGPSNFWIDCSIGMLREQMGRKERKQREEKII